MDNELGEREVERAVCERDLLRRRVAHVDSGVPLARCLDERLRRIDRRDVHGAEPCSELGRQRARPAADIERAPARFDACKVREKRSELPGKPAHEAVVGARRREELTHAQTVDGEPTPVASACSTGAAGASLRPPMPAPPASAAMGADRKTIAAKSSWFGGSRTGLRGGGEAAGIETPSADAPPRTSTNVVPRWISPHGPRAAPHPPGRPPLVCAPPR